MSGNRDDDGKFPVDELSRYVMRQADRCDTGSGNQLIGRVA